MKQVTPPESRRAPIDWYDPATMVAMLERIGREFGAEARFAEIMFMDDKVVITARDPRQPGELAQILLTKDGFTRFGTPSMLAARIPIERVRAGFDRAMFDELAEAGVFSLRADGFSWADCVVVFEQLSQHRRVRRPRNICFLVCESVETPEDAIENFGVIGELTAR